MLEAFRQRCNHTVKELGIPTVLLLLFLVVLPKGGVKPFGIPISWGSLLLALFAAGAFFHLAYQKSLSKTHLIAFLYTLPFALVAAISIAFLGQGNTGFTISLFYCFFLAPLAFLLLFQPALAALNIELFLRVLCGCVVVVAAYGILLFFYKYYTGHFIEIPYLTINAGDAGLIERKHINRGGVFKLISTYNNGNVYGVSILMLLPLVHRRCGWWQRWLVKTSLILTLSRTVWIGLLIHELFRLLWGRISWKMLLKFGGMAAAGMAAMTIILPLIGQDTGFLLDKNFGGRLAQISNTLEGGVSLFPTKPFSVIAEIAYISVLNTFGVVGLVAFLGALILPLIYARKQGSFTPYQQDILFGLILYLVVSFSDSASLYLPVMLFYWAGAGLLLRREGKAASLRGAKRQSNPRF